jgi:hypothetical protein
MADVVNRTTRVHLRSVNTPDYPASEWIINPDLSAVAGVPTRYWLISGNTVTEMTPAQKAAVDAAEAAAAKAPPADPVAGQQWFNQDANTLFAYDAVRGRWLSVNTQTVIFTRDGVLVDGSLGIGSTYTLDSGFLNPRDHVIVGISAVIGGGDATKTFDILQDDSLIAGFTLSGGQHVSGTVNLDLAAGTHLRCYATGTGAVVNPVVHFELAWAYNP